MFLILVKEVGNVQSYLCLSPHVCACVYACVHVCVRMCAHVYTRVYTFAHLCVYACVHVYVMFKRRFCSLSNDALFFDRAFFDQQQCKTNTNIQTTLTFCSEKQRG